jgi:NAD(P)-dependent dehydrogenase (short-subunit alcohol dehydrogenase family)
LAAELQRLGIDPPSLRCFGDSGHAAQLNITANVIAPGPVETDINSRFLTRPEIRKRNRRTDALRRIGEVEDIINLTRFLASNRSQWITGHVAARGRFRL